MKTFTHSSKTGVVGAGLIGRAWAMVFARAGLQVKIFDADAKALSACMGHIETLVQDMHGAELVHENPADIVRRITPVSSLAELCTDVDLIQENIRETLEAKIAIFSQLDALTHKDTILASSTSWLPTSLFTKDLAGRERCLVAHPTNPPYLIPLVEVSPAPWTSEKATQSAMSFYKLVAQEPILVRKEIHGFLLNRVQGAVLNEMLNLYEQGFASAEDLDKVMKFGLGLRWSFMGPFETIDLNAPDGVVDYANRYGHTYAEVSKTQVDNTWEPQVITQIESERRQVLSHDQLESRSHWRDRRLMALRRHQKDQPT
jgi:3-hydroxyacyl-CoA dehydrogenase